MCFRTARVQKETADLPSAMNTRSGNVGRVVRPPWLERASGRDHGSRPQVPFARTSVLPSVRSDHVRERRRRLSAANEPRPAAVSNTDAGSGVVVTGGAVSFDNTYARSSSTRYAPENSTP